jgi:pimeloyl-ACP methyl ester carboxylesterase
MGLLLAALVVALAGLGAFVSWRRRALALVRNGSEIAETTQGVIEFARAGKGPIILQLHGGAAGYDQTLAISWDLHEAGFTVLTPSRPGYLRTPLTAGATPEQAADAVAGLLDVLGIDRVCIMGTSGGGPTALQLALRHPERIWGLVLQSAISQRFVEPHRSTHSLIGWVLFSRGKWLADFGAWGAHLVARYWPSLLIRSLLNASDDLERSKANERLAYVLRHPEQIAFFRRLAASGMPLSVRQTGLHNDLHQFAALPVYPLERITCPTLVMHGRADGNVPLAHAAFVAGAVPNAELFALEGCGHFIWVGHGAGQYRERVREFLSRHVPPPATENRSLARTSGPEAAAHPG